MIVEENGPGIVLRLLGCALMSSAQTNAEPTRDEVIVTGERLTRERMRERAVAYVRVAGVANGERAAARWIDPICPRVLGIGPKLAGRVEARIRAAAKTADVPLAPAKCTPNIVVSFVEGAGGVVRRIAARQPRQLSEMPSSARDTLVNENAPIRWWYSTEVRGKDGDRLFGAEPPFVSGNGAPGQTLPGNGDTSFLSLYNSNLVSTQIARAIRSATVIVDVDEAKGATLDAVSDYAALVALAELKPTVGSRPGSILGLFDEAEAPGGLTEWDARFLRELYRLPLDRRARQHRGMLVSAILDGEREP